MRVYWFSVLLALVAVLGGCASTPEIAADDSIEALHARATQALFDGDVSLARTSWLDAVAASRSCADASATASFLLELTELEDQVGDFDAAEQYARQALKLVSGGTNVALEAGALNGLALVARRRADYSCASSLLEQAVELARRAADPRRLSAVLRNTGAIYQAKGQFRQALDYYRKALGVARDGQASTEEAKTLNNLGGLHMRQAKYPQARNSFAASLAIRQRLNDRPGTAKILGNLCNSSIRLNALATARDQCRQALAMAREIGDRQLEANVRNSLGAVYGRLGDATAELDSYRASVALKRALGDRAGEARGLNNIGVRLFRGGKVKQAIPYLERALIIKRDIETEADAVATQYNLAEAYARIGDRSSAREGYAAVLASAGAGQPELAWRGADGLARLYAASGETGLAVFCGKQAVNTIQAVRQENLALEKQLQRTFLDDKYQVYRRLAAQLVRQGRLPEAEQVLGMLKEAEYVEFIRRDAPADAYATHADYSAFEQEQLTQLNEATRSLAVLSEEARLIKLIRRRDRSPEQTARLRELTAALEPARRSFETAWDQILDAFAEVERGDSSADLAVKLLDNDLSGLVKELSEQTSRGVALIHYVLLDDRLHILLTLSGLRVSREVAVGASEINQEIQVLRDALQQPPDDPLPAAQWLYEQLIAPIASGLEGADIEHLMVYLDGALRYLPMATLHDGQHYLVEDYALSVYTAAAERNIKDTPSPDWELAGLGLSQAYPGFQPLPAVPLELEGIVSQGEDDPDGVLDGVILLDQTFTRQALSDALHDGYPVVHLASHFVFQPGTEADSFLLLGDGSELDLGELRRGDFVLGDVDLLTLSACETAIGGQNAQGREVEGLAALAQEEGAKGVLATLWPVADASTAAFMQRFYTLKVEQDLTKAEALRQAQLAFLYAELAGSGNQVRGATPVAPDDAIPSTPTLPDYSHPYYWAPFILMGNWL